jgi:YD repeat-containing protein
MAVGGAWEAVPAAGIGRSWRRRILKMHDRVASRRASRETHDLCLDGVSLPEYQDRRQESPGSRVTATSSGNGLIMIARSIASYVSRSIWPPAPGHHRPWSCRAALEPTLHLGLARAILAFVVLLLCATGVQAQKKSDCPPVNDRFRPGHLPQFTLVGDPGFVEAVSTVSAVGDPAGGDAGVAYLLGAPDIEAPHVGWVGYPRPPIEPIPPMGDPLGGKDRPDPEPSDPGLPYLTTTTEPSNGCQCACGAPAACDLNTEPPRLGLPVPPAFAFPQSASTADHASVLVRDGDGRFIWQSHTGAGQVANTQYVRYVDGTVVEMEVASIVGQKIRWRPTVTLDAYDNRTNYRYDGLGRLTRIERPSGIDEVYEGLDLTLSSAWGFTQRTS